MSTENITPEAGIAQVAMEFEAPALDPHWQARREIVRGKIISKCQSDEITSIYEVVACVSRCVAGKKLAEFAQDMINRGEITDADLVVVE